MSTPNGCNKPGGIPDMLENPLSSKAGLKVSGGGQSLLLSDSVCSTWLNLNPALQNSKNLKGQILRYIGYSGVQQCVNLTQQQVEETQKT